MKTNGVLFTDLDGTLLDFFSHMPSSKAIEVVGELRDCGVLTVPVTSKTEVEVERLGAIYDLIAIALVEGGAVILRKRTLPEILGRSRRWLVDILQGLQSEGFPLRGMSQMSQREVCELTGLSFGEAALAMQRVASEPFIFTCDAEEIVEAVRAHAHGMGAEITRGGKLWHLQTLGLDKGSSVRRLLDNEECLSGVLSGSVGDAWNDLSMLRTTDHGYLLGQAVADGEVAEGVVRLTERGPRGFVRAATSFARHCADTVQ